jgi:hypothetical protein
MASISTDSRGNVAIQFMADRKRRTLRLGKIGRRTAEKIKGHVEDLAAAKRMRQSFEPRTASSVADLDDGMAGRVAALELITSRTPMPTVTLGAFLESTWRCGWTQSVRRGKSGAKLSAISKRISASTGNWPRSMKVKRTVSSSI